MNRMRNHRIIAVLVAAVVSVIAMRFVFSLNPMAGNPDVLISEPGAGEPLTANSE
jgi:hypothetical protein